MGCRYCMMSCPYGIPRYDWEKAIPFVRKCVFCDSRIAAGRQPACTEACTQRATIFGTREAMIEEAHRRIKERPDHYVDKVFGETEIGGTSVLYISDIPLDFLAYKPNMGDQPLDDLTWAALSKVPALALSVGGLMAGVWWVTGRRMKLAADSAVHEQDPTAEDSESPDGEPPADSSKEG